MGKSDADGWIDEWIAPSTREVLLIIDGRRYQVRLGHVDPASTERGVRSRLVNLGYLELADADLSQALVAKHGG